MINQNYSQNQLTYSLYNGIRNTYFGMLCYIMLDFITNKPIKPIGPRKPKEPKKPTKRISARQVQDNLDAFIKEQRQVNKILLEFVKETKEFMTEQREFNKKIMERIDNIVAKNNLVE